MNNLVVENKNNIFEGFKIIFANNMVDNQELEKKIEEINKKTDIKYISICENFFVYDNKNIKKANKLKVNNKEEDKLKKKVLNKKEGLEDIDKER